MGCPPWSGGIPRVEGTFQGLNQERCRLAVSPGPSEGCSLSAAPALRTLQWGNPSLCRLPPCSIWCLSGVRWDQDVEPQGGQVRLRG